ncbi:MAG: sigma 54-interacting transcriptional regulator [Natronohydrobacter sp.]|nr:sigma 54-interacting transcriptional regulator [Natronohydrobacter sp.]
MANLHFFGTDSLFLDRLAELMARRRIGVTRGDIEHASGAVALVGIARTAADEQELLQATRSLKLRNLVVISLGAERLQIDTALGGSLLRVALPMEEADSSDPHGRLLLAYLAEMIAAPIRPMVANDPATGGLIDLAMRVAAARVSVLINGPTGSGKEVLSRAIHDASPRAAKPFIAINCAAIPENMLEAMLFGHVKGAFTGAVASGQGLIRAADGGTLLLDEISEMPLGLQAKLLRVLQERKVTPLGSSGEIEVDIRVISTTNRNMRDEITAGRFREDLYYRLNVFPLQTLALQDRPEDIVPLAVAFLRRHWTAGPVPLFTPTALDVLQFHTWPGNVRELENVVQRALVLCDGMSIDVDDLLFDPPARGSAPSPETTVAPAPFRRSLSAAV